MNPRHMLLTALVALASLPAFAELRVWTDTKGKTIEAEHVRTLTDKVVLRKPDGTEIQVALDTLSDRDRKYAILQTPPRIDISVSVKNDRENRDGGRDQGSGFQVQQETVVVEVKVRKSSSQPYEGPLRAELYVIGQPEQKEAYVILDKQVSRFSFAADTSHDFTSDAISIRQLEAGQQKGVEYKGYLVVVRDKTREIIALKCSKLDYEKHAEAIMAADKGEALDAEFKPMGNVQDKLDKTPQRPNRQPGRRF